MNIIEANTPPSPSVGSSVGLGGSAPTADIVRAINELLLVRNASGVSAAEIAEVVYREIGEWTVRAADYDQLAKAARELRAACKNFLPPGSYALLDEECDAIDAILSPNDQSVPPADKKTPPKPQDD